MKTEGRFLLEALIHKLLAACGEELLPRQLVGLQPQRAIVNDGDEKSVAVGTVSAKHPPDRNRPERCQQLRNVGDEPVHGFGRELLGRTSYSVTSTPRQKAM